MTATSEYSDVEYVFEPHTAAMPDLRKYLAALWERRPFLVALADADLRGPRSSTMLGNLWSVLDPLFQASIYFFLYAVMRGSDSERMQFLPALIGGIFLFGLTTAALGEGGASIRRSKSLMLSSTFPKALLPLTTIYRTLRKFATSAGVFVVIFVAIGGKLGMGLFVLPLLFVLQVTMNIGIALLMSTFYAFVPDAPNVMNYVTRVLFFTTPVIYPVSLLPPGALALVSWMPLFGLFASYQAIFTGEVPSPALVLQTAFWAVALLVVGSRAFLRHEQQFALHI
jgi:teichoic acid transport system permease protein